MHADDSLRCSVDGMTVRFKREGEGPALLLLHGSGGSLDAFDAMTAELQSSFEVIRPDLPGFGLTGPHSRRDYRVETYVSFVRDFLGTQRIKRCVVVGHSFGGNVAWNLALRHPERVERLVLMNATGYPDKSVPPAFRLARNPLTRPLVRYLGSRTATARNVTSMVGPNFQVPEAMVDRIHAMMSRPGSRQAFIDFARTDQADTSAGIAKITAPTLVLRASGIDGQHFARDIPGAREVVFDGVGHLMPEEAPAQAAREILSFCGATT
jgi:pimeloyl-ACP methyl ester carboxylesterase